VAANREFRRAIELNPGNAHAHPLVFRHLALLVVTTRPSPQWERLKVWIDCPSSSMPIWPSFFSLRIVSTNRSSRAGRPSIWTLLFLPRIVHSPRGGKPQVCGSNRRTSEGDPALRRQPGAHSRTYDGSPAVTELLLNSTSTESNSVGATDGSMLPLGCGCGIASTRQSDPRSLAIEHP
jgi:hypothetical protein